MHKGLEAGLVDGSVTFPVDHCGHCGGDVLVYPRLRVNGTSRTLVWRCLFCDHELEGGGQSVVYRTIAELIVEAIETDSVDLDDVWAPLDFPLDISGGHKRGK